MEQRCQRANADTAQAAQQMAAAEAMRVQVEEKKAAVDQQQQVLSSPLFGCRPFSSSFHCLFLSVTRAIRRAHILSFWDVQVNEEMKANLEQQSIELAAKKYALTCILDSDLVLCTRCVRSNLLQYTTPPLDLFRHVFVQ